MAIIRGKTLFFTTSPRTPAKMIPEIKLLCENFQGEIWNPENQINFMEMLIKDESFQGNSSLKDKALSARDRITRSPKALGFVDLKPYIQLTEAGEKFIYGTRTGEVLLRQLLKFQLPSPYHKKNKKNNVRFNVKPYLEIIRLIKELNGISFDELKIFGMQLTDYNYFENIVEKIKKFRIDKKKLKKSYKQYFLECQKRELLEIYKTDILNKNLFIREQREPATLKKFLKTKTENLRDYTDACFRCLRTTGLFTISYKERKLSIMHDKIVEVDFILKNISRDPVYIHDELNYKNYLFNSGVPTLYTDNKDNLIDTIMKAENYTKVEISNYSIDELKDLRDNIYQKNREKAISKEVKKLKSYDLYTEVIDTYNQINSKELYDMPLILEWNTWRALTMLNGGKITGNFILDDFGKPMSTAPGNIADIICDYKDFSLTVEVTMQSGVRQHETEGEPVARHLAKYKKEINRDVYCLFITPKLNNATIAHFFGLHKINIDYYGGNSIIVPLELDVFMMMIENSYIKDNVPDSNDVKEIFLKSEYLAKKAQNEKEWFLKLQAYAREWPKKLELEV